MAQPTFEQLLWSISVQESGGSNYGIVNAYGAVGKYQVLKSNIPSWSKAALGYSITWQKFRDSPDLQEKIVRHRLGGYYKQYGFRGAASAWYSGNPKLDQSTRPQPGGPSIKKYVDDVEARARKAPANLKTGGPAPGNPSGGGGGGKKTAPIDAEATLEEYGFVKALMDSDPELKKIFNKIKTGEIASPGKFQAELQDTKWWKTHSDTARKFLGLQFGDPATAKQQLDQAKLKVRQLAESMGMHVDEKMLKKIDGWALNSILKGWTDGQLRNELGKYVTFGDDGWGGEGGEIIEKMKSYAYSMGVDPAGSFFADGARLVLRGLATEQDYEDKMRKMAKGIYSQWSDQLDAGMTVADIASPYFQSMAQILELPSGSINLFDPTIKKALQNKDPKTGIATPKPLWQFENDLRSDNRWKSTQNAQNSMMQIAHQVLADFGAKY